MGLVINNVGQYRPNQIWEKTNRIKGLTQVKLVDMFEILNIELPLSLERRHRDESGGMMFDAAAIKKLMPSKLIKPSEARHD